MITNELYDIIHSNDLAGASAWINARPDQIDAQVSEGYTALHIAALFGAEPIIRFLLSKGALVNQNAENASLATPLHLAVGYREENVAKQICLYLLNCGAELNARQSGGLTPLHHAVSRGSLTLVETLIDEGADPFLKDDQGVSASDLAKKLEEQDAENGSSAGTAIRAALKKAFSLPLEPRS